MSACVTFVVQSSQQSNIRAIFAGDNARSNTNWPLHSRAKLDAAIADLGANILVIQLQGYLFFGNIHRVVAGVERALETENMSIRIRKLKRSSSSSLAGATAATAAATSSTAAGEDAESEACDSAAMDSSLFYPRPLSPSKPMDQFLDKGDDRDIFEWGAEAGDDIDGVRMEDRQPSCCGDGDTNSRILLPNIAQGLGKDTVGMESPRPQGRGYGHADRLGLGHAHGGHRSRQGSFDFNEMNYCKYVILDCSFVTGADVNAVTALLKMKVNRICWLCETHSLCALCALCAIYTLCVRCMCCICSRCGSVSRSDPWHASCFSQAWKNRWREQSRLRKRFWSKGEFIVNALVWCICA